MSTQFTMEELRERHVRTPDEEVGFKLIEEAWESVQERFPGYTVTEGIWSRDRYAEIKSTEGLTVRIWTEKGENRNEKDVVVGAYLGEEVATDVLVSIILPLQGKERSFVMGPRGCYLLRTIQPQQPGARESIGEALVEAFGWLKHLFHHHIDVIRDTLPISPLDT